MLKGIWSGTSITQRKKKNNLCHLWLCSFSIIIEHCNLPTIYGHKSEKHMSHLTKSHFLTHYFYHKISRKIIPRIPVNPCHYWLLSNSLELCTILIQFNKLSDNKKTGIPYTSRLFSLFYVLYRTSPKCTGITYLCDFYALSN